MAAVGGQRDESAQWAADSGWRDKSSQGEEEVAAMTAAVMSSHGQWAVDDATRSDGGAGDDATRAGGNDDG